MNRNKIILTALSKKINVMFFRLKKEEQKFSLNNQN